jgi:hypothetical protein
MKVDWKHPSDAPMGVRLMVCDRTVYGCEHEELEPGVVRMATHVGGPVWVSDDRTICAEPDGWDHVPDVISYEEFHARRVHRMEPKP